MSNSGPVSGVPTPRPAPSVLEPNARVTGVPRDLSDIKIPVKVEGQVVAQNRDGTVRVQTPQGAIDISLPRPPQEGERVEVTLLPGRPPRQAVVKEAPPQQQTPQAPPTSSQPAPGRPPQETPAPPPRTVETPVNVEVKPQPVPTAPLPTTQTPSQTAPVQATQPAVPLPPLEPDAVVTLLPLTPTQEAQIVYPAPEQIVESIVQNVQVAAQTLATEIQNSIVPSTPSAQIVSFLPEAVPNPLQALQTTPTPIQTPITTLLSETPATLPQGTPVTFTVPEILPLQQVTLPSVQVAAPTFTQPVTPFVLSNESVFTPPIFTAPVSVKIQSIQLPGVELELPTAEPKAFAPDFNIKNAQQPETGPVIKAVVTGVLQQHPVVTLFSAEGQPLQNLWMQVSSETVVPGTQLQITLPTTQPAPLIPAALPGAPLPVSFLTPEPWPLFEQITQALSQIAPQAAQALANATPNPATPARFGPAALFFLAAVRTGDLAGWIGEKTIDILRKDGRGNFLSRLTQEGNALNRLATESVSGDWRAMSVPIYYQGEMQRMALYYRHDEGGGMEGAEKNTSTRFIFDLNLSRMGKVQVDGLCRPKKLDLILRTEQPFGQMTQMQLRRTYINALEQTDLSGEMSFQSRPEQWVAIHPTHKDLFSSAI